jgi:hypothetical protein
MATNLMSILNFIAATDTENAAGPASTLGGLQNSNMVSNTYDMTPIDWLKKKSTFTSLSSQAPLVANSGIRMDGPSTEASVPTSTGPELLSRVAIIWVLPIPLININSENEFRTMHNTLSYMCTTAFNELIFDTDFSLYSALISAPATSLHPNFSIMYHYLHSIFQTQHPHLLRLAIPEDEKEEN